MYKISHGTTTITVDTQEELHHVLDYIRKQDADQPKVKRNRSGFEALALAMTGGAPIDTNPWTHKTFQTLLRRLAILRKELSHYLSAHRRFPMLRSERLSAWIQTSSLPEC